MPTYKKRPNFFETDEGIATQAALSSMVLDSMYVTTSTFSANTNEYQDNLIPFVDKHMTYLRDHPSVDPTQYLANLRLMTKIRQ